MNRKIFFILITLLAGIMVNSTPATGMDVFQSEPLAIVLSSEPLSCASDQDGRATVTVTGGKLPYSFKWSNGAYTQTITDLSEGTYFVTVTDDEGTQEKGHITVKSDNLLKVDFTLQKIKCTYDTDGEITASPQNGKGPYTYHWNTGSTDSFIKDLGGGMFMVTITDANGCQTEEMVILEEPEPLEIDAFYAHVSCGETADGFMEVTATGGTEPYTFYWELDGKGGNRRENLKAGLYSVTVTDKNGCTAMICPEILQSKPPGLTVSSVPETCPGEGNGWATVTPNGDSPPYRFEWSGGVSQHSSAFNLTAGIYTVTVTNFRNCSSTVEVIIGQAGGGFGFFVQTNGVACGNAPNGRAEVIMTGGVAPFSYEWVDKNTNETIGSGFLADDLLPGSYTVLVTDANGCFGKNDVLITEKPIPSISAVTLVPEVCFGEQTGLAEAIATGGEGAFTYTWNTGQETSDISGLGVGTYTVTASDINGCTAVTDIEITEKAEIFISEELTHLLCYEQPEGAILVTASGGAGNFTYEWSDGTTSNSIANLGAGTYFITVTNAEGCQKSKGITIEQPANLNISVTTTNASDLNRADGAVNSTVSGGTAPYSFLWNNGATTQNLMNIPAGNYSLTVTDANGCQQSTSTIIVEASCTVTSTISIIQPASCAINDGAVSVAVSGAKGEVSYEWSNGANTSVIEDLVSGYYAVTVTDEMGCQVVSGTFITNDCDCIKPVIENILVFETGCGQSNGSLAIQMQGGNDNFVFEWNNDLLMGNSGSSLPEGTYHVNIRDKSNPLCAITETISVGNTNIGPVVEILNEPEICNVSKGSVLLLPESLDFKWSDGGTGNLRDDLSAGKYLVTVTIPGLDSCQEIIPVTVGLKSGLELSPSFNRLPNCGSNDGSVTINVSGGSSQYDFSWGSATQNNLPAGIYKVLVSDQITGCKDSLLFTLRENIAGVAVEIDSVSNVSCSGGLDGAVYYQLIETGDFAGPAKILIVDAGGQAYESNNLPAGDFCVVAYDINGCIAGQACFTVTQPDYLLVNVTVIPKTCNVENSILLTSSGGNGLYTYNWADLTGLINPRDRTGIDNGMYSVTVSDELGCSLSVENIEVNGECFICTLEANATINSMPDCGLPNGSVSIEVTNSFGNLTYSWDGDSKRTDLRPDDYTVTVTDDFRGCETEVSFVLKETELPKEAAIDDLTVCPDESGKLNYDISNFKCAKQPVSVVITDAEGQTYDENALTAFENYIFIVYDADGIEISRQFFTVGSYEPIITAANITSEGCTTPGVIDLKLSKPEENFHITWNDLSGDEQPADRSDLKKGIYTVTITDKGTGGCSLVREFEIGKNTNITAELIPVAITCDNNPVQVHLQGEDLVSYVWTPASLITEGQGTASPTIQGENELSIVSVTAINSFGCFTNKEVKVISVVTDPPGGIQATSQCDGLTIGFSSMGNSSTHYWWDFGDGNFSDEPNPVHTYEKEGDYEVRLNLKPDVPCASEKGVIARKTIKLVDDAKTVADFIVDYDPCLDEGVVQFRDASVVKPGKVISWKWTFSNGETSEEASPKITLETSADLEVSLEIETDIGCKANISEQYTFPVIHMPKMDDSLVICPGQPSELNPNPTSGVTYEWSPAELLDDPLSPNPTVIVYKPVEFTVKITQGECIRKDIVKLDVPPEQEYELSEDAIVCDESRQLIFVEPPTSSKIEWTKAGSAMVVGQESTLMAEPGIYQVKLTDPNNCIVKDEVAIENHAVNAIIEDNTDPCIGGYGKLVVMNTGPEQITSYKWEETLGIITPDLEQSVIEVEPAEKTDYAVTVKNEYGCEMTLSQTVVISNVEEIEAIPEKDTIFNGDFTGIQVSPAEGFSIEWTNSGTLDDPSSFTPNASPEETTTYSVTVTDEKTGCNAVRDVTVHVRQVVCGEPNIFVPNAFSPNGDGFNDILRVRGNAIASVQFMVFNRWGEKVFESNDLNVGWDGMFMGQKVSSDVYGYYLRVVCLAGDVFETQGNVTVLN